MHSSLCIYGTSTYSGQATFVSYEETLDTPIRKVIVESSNVTRDVIRIRGMIGINIIEFDGNQNKATCF